MRDSSPSFPLEDALEVVDFDVVQVRLQFDDPGVAWAFLQPFQTFCEGK